jgi:hypothetical protein
MNDFIDKKRGFHFQFQQLAGRQYLSDEELMRFNGIEIGYGTSLLPLYIPLLF